MMLSELPTELLCSIFSAMTAQELSTMRLVCKRLRTLADHPSQWRDIMLIQPSSGHSKTLWRLDDLKGLIEPHREHIRTVRIHGVRDCIVRYLLQCPRLEELTLCEWRTLSNHAFQPPVLSQRLRRLAFVSSTRQFSHISVDATSLGRFIKRCPALCELALKCMVHVHAQTLLTELRRSRNVLQSLTLWPYNPWNEEHISQMQEVCPYLEDMCVVPPSTRAHDLQSGWIGKPTNAQYSIDDGTNRT